MKIALLSMLLGGQLVIHVADTVPDYKVEESCKGSAAASNAEGISESQTLQSCMNDENQAKQQLMPIWTTYSPALRTQCEGEATSGGLPSYVDLLVCLQIAKDTSATPDSVTPLKGASKKKRKKKS